MLQPLGERLGGAEAQGIDAGALKSAVQVSEAFGIDTDEFFPDGGAMGIQLEQLAGLRIFDGQQTGRGQDTLARIMEVEAD